jgi:aminocarboxymuconate-semialdehyde decarboxylase
MMIDVFNHILPQDYIAAVDRLATKSPPVMFERARHMPAMSDIDSRFRVMDQFPGYEQILSLSSPTVDALAGTDRAVELSRYANDSLAALVARYPSRFPAFIATLPLTNPTAAAREAERAIRELKAVGVQIYTNVAGHPLDEPEFLELFACLAGLQRPVWLHPIRPMTYPDYSSEQISKFDLWWAFGWPHETSVAMGRLVFAGLFDRWPDLVVITHHAGGTIPLFEGRIESGLSVLGERNGPEHAFATKTELKGPPLQAFKRFYADTATFGSRAALDCSCEFFGLSHLLFATDMPFDPEQGPGYIRDTIRAISHMNLNDVERKDLFEGNIKRLLRWNQ